MTSGHAFTFWRTYLAWSDESYPHASCRCGWEWEDGTWGMREDARRAYRKHKAQKGKP